MIYTLGRTTDYEQCFRDMETTGRRPAKVGRFMNATEGYCGGSVWQTPEEVQRHIDSKPATLDGYSVYGVEADWTRDTTASQNGPWHDLLINAPLYRLSELKEYDANLWFQRCVIHPDKAFQEDPDRYFAVVATDYVSQGQHLAVERFNEIQQRGINPLARHLRKVAEELNSPRFSDSPKGV